MKNYLILFFIIIFNKTILAQMGVNSDGSQPHSSAQLDVKSANKGLLLPRVTSPASAIASPAAGLMVYDQANANLSYFNGASWQNLTGNSTANSLFARFPNSRAFFSTLHVTGGGISVYTFTVPAGINTIWVEMWGPGGYGGELPSLITEYSTTGNGGRGGDYASFIMPATAAEVIQVQVGKGGYSNVNGGGESRIMGTGGDYAVNKQNVIGYNASYSVQQVPGLIQFIPGGQAGRTSSRFEQSGSTEFRRVLKGGNGGDSYLSNGGIGTEVSYLLPSGAVIGYQTVVGTNGAWPGGGGGCGYGANNGGYGGPGLIIVHW